MFFSYYLFVPVVYGALLLYYILQFKKQTGKIINKDMIWFTILTLIAPFCIGMIYHVLPGIISTEQVQVQKLVQVEGYIYRNLLSNFVLLIPFTLYYFYDKIVEKNLSHIDIFTLLLIMYMLALYIGTIFFNISTYYFFKNYFVMWLVAWYLSFKGIAKLCENKKKCGKYISTIFIVTYIAILIYSFFNVNVEINKKKFNPDEKITDVMDIYGINKTVTFKVDEEFTQEEMKLLEFAKENMKLENKNTLLLANQRQEFWIWTILKYRYKDNLNYVTSEKYINRWNKKEYEYLIYFTKSTNYIKYKDIVDFKDAEVLYKNNSGSILKNN